MTDDVAPPSDPASPTAPEPAPARPRSSSDGLSFAQLVFSDYRRHRPGARASWLGVLARVPTSPGLLASIVLRAQQCLFRAGHERLAHSLRIVSTVLVGADFGAGMTVGTGLLLAHPHGVTIGFGLVLGDDVTLAGGVTAAARHWRGDQPQEFAVVGDRVTIGAHAVLVGGVHVGDDAMIGANSVVLSDVPAGTTVMGNPARRVAVAPSAGSAS